jgi:hypothetical protein
MFPVTVLMPSPRRLYASKSPMAKRLSIILLFSVISLAQSNTGELRLKVVDPSGPPAADDQFLSMPT